MNLSTLLDQFREPISRAIVAMYPPLLLPKGPTAEGLPPLLRRPKGAQADAIRAAAHSLRRETATTIVGEMGVGKTYIALAALRQAGFRRPIVVCPPQLTEQWCDEARRTIPGAQATILRSVADVEQVRRDTSPFLVSVLSREKAKLGPHWQPVYYLRPVFDPYRRRALREQVTDQLPRASSRSQPTARDYCIVRQAACPDCGALVKDEDGTLVTPERLEKRRMRCPACHGALWSVRPAPRRAALADYIRNHAPKLFDCVVADEWHEFKARGSAQGIAAAALIGAIGKVLALTGTLCGGYSSTLFCLLFRADPLIRAEYGWKDEAKWIARYGIYEQIDTLADDDEGEDGRTSKRKITSSRTHERPGITPAILLKLLRNTVFLHLPDVATDLPPYRERVVAVPMDAEALPLLDLQSGEQRLDSKGDLLRSSQAQIYAEFAHELHEAVKEALVHNSKRLLGAYLQALLGWVDSPFREERVYDPRERRRVTQLPAELAGSALEPLPIATAPALPDDRLYPKERALVELCQDNQRRGRRVMIYVQHTGTRDILPRLQSILARHSFRAAILRSSTVPPEQRSAWLADREREGVDGCLLHPRLVQTGLNLTGWASIIWYQGEYSIYTLRQASRRSWRLGQDKGVEVTHLAYDGTLQTAQLALVSAKLRSSLMLEGHMQTDGLAALAGDDGDTFVQLARRLTQEDAGGADAQEALDALATFENEANDDLLAEEVKEELARVAAEGPVPAVIPPEPAAGPAAEPDGTTGVPLAADAARTPALQPSRQLSFLQLRQELLRKGVKLPKPRGRRAAPGQASLFE